MATGTNNPIGSDDPRDVRANAKNFDAFSLSPDESFSDRKGVERLTLAGMEARFEGIDPESFYQDLGDYAAGIEVARENQLIRKDGDLYRIADAGDLPYTTTGDWPTDSVKLDPVGDTALRQELASVNGAQMVAFQSQLVGSVPTDLKKMAEDGQAVKAKFGIIGDGIADDSDAIQAALLSTNRALLFPAGDYRITRTLYRVQGLILGEGFQTRFIFEGLNGDDGIVFAPVSYAQTSGALNLSMVTKDSNGGRAFSTPYDANQYRVLYSNWRWQNLEFRGFTDPSPGTNNAFETIETWLTGIEQGDGFSCRICNNYFRGNSRSDTDPALQPESTYLRLNAASALLTAFVGEFTATNLFRGIDIAQRCFFQILRFDIAHATEGITQTAAPGAVYGESKVLHGNINAQRHGVKFNAIGTREISGVVVRRHRYGWKGATNDWVGIDLTDCNYTWLRDNQYQPDASDGAFAGDAYGLRMTRSNGVISGNVIGLNLKYGISLDNCTMCSFSHTHSFQNGAAEFLFDLRNNTRNSSLGDYKLVSSFAGEVYRDDGTIGGTVQFYGRDIQPVGSAPVYYYRRPASALNEKIWRTVVGGNTWALQTVDDTGASNVNQIVVTRLGTSGSTIDFRPTTTITANLRPSADAVRNFGEAALRWNNSYFAVAPTVSSDERLKQQIGDISETVLDAWQAVGYQAYKFNDAIAIKGADQARWHFGLIAQKVRDEFSKRGLDACKMGLLCYDEWGDEYEPVIAQRINEGTGEVEDFDTGTVRLVRAAGDQWAVRYEEALCLEAALQRRTIDRLELLVSSLQARVEAMEGKG